MKMDYIVKAISEKGQSHKLNEDSHVVGDEYIIVADGMGGESSGEVASKLTIDTVSEILDRDLPCAVDESEIKNLLFLAIMKADSEILRYVSEHPDSVGMGNTIVVMIRKFDKGHVAWCGDSRCYLYSEGHLRGITKDHSYVQELIDENKISVKDSLTHPDNNLLTKFVGGGEDTCVPDFISFDMSKDTSVILCSDGLSGYCLDEEIEREISSSNDIDIPSRLVQLAIRNGSEDDITIVSMTPKRTRKSIFDWFRSLKE